MIIAGERYWLFEYPTNTGWITTAPAVYLHDDIIFLKRVVFYLLLPVFGTWKPAFVPFYAYRR